MKQEEFVKKLNRYFHDIEADYFAYRHALRLKDEAKLYREFFQGYSLSFASENIKILELGTGTGLVPEIVASFDNPCLYVCTDISFSMLNKIKKSAQISHKEFLHYVVCDSENLPFKKDVFNLVICNAALHHFPNIDGFSLEVDYVLERDGMIVIGHEPNRRFWTNRAVSLVYRLLQKISRVFAKKPFVDISNGYKKICQQVNDRLLKDDLIKKPLSNEDLLGYVDVHSPNSGAKIDYSRGFIAREIKEKFFKKYSVKDLRYHYHSKNFGNGKFLGKLFNIYNKAFFSNCAPLFSLILEKSVKKKILFLFWHLNFGGAEVGLLTTLNNIDRKRFHCLVVCIEKKGPIGEEIEKLGFEVLYLNQRARLFNLLPIIKIARIIRKYKPDILHSSLFYANFYARVTSCLQKVPIKITEERSMYYEKRPYHMWIDRLLSHFTDKILVCSRSVLEFTKKQERISEEKFHLIYNAVDEKRFDISQTKIELRNKYGFLEHHFIVGTVGSVIPKKGHIFLIKATEKLSQQIPNYKVLIVGNGESREQLENVVREKSLSPFITFIDATKDIPALMKIMDIFVLPSLQEGFPRVLVEAMYMGLPIVASSISGIPEIVLDGETGFLVSPGDSESISQHIFNLYKDNRLVQKMSTRARQRVQSNFIAGEYMKRLEQLYNKLLNSKTRYKQ